MVRFLNHPRQFGFFREGLVKKAASGVLGALSSFALTDLALFAPFALTYSMYAAGAKFPAALLDSLFTSPSSFCQRMMVKRL
jgi:hypothetical protein